MVRQGPDLQDDGVVHWRFGDLNQRMLESPELAENRRITTWKPHRDLADKSVVHYFT